MDDMHFVYINAQGCIAAHSIENVSHSESYTQGICKKTHSIKTFRNDRVLKQYSSSEQATQECNKFHPENYSHLIKKSESKPKTFDVCFTGFKKADKDRLIGIGIARGLTIRSSVTQNLQMLCCGYNAGPSKVTAARMNGVIIINELGFIHFIDTGEIPDE
ncbi:hypothetical protein [Plesiomonas sp.]|uniref:hypothetical protein n=1 Tax=Plesiomonas sp. TaxID=2486279 RepID=UPI003F2CB3A5